VVPLHINYLREKYAAQRVCILRDASVESYFDSPEFETDLANDDGLAAKQHLAAGRAIYYGDERYPEGLVKKYPDGRMQLVTIDGARKVIVLRDL
jgi:hypothetical protein